MARIDSITLEYAFRYIGRGWRELVTGVYDAFEQHAEGAVVHVQQVMEKFGRLQMYAHVDPPNCSIHTRTVSRPGAAPTSTAEDEDGADAIRAAIQAAETASRRTCQMCGRAGEICGRRWLKTLCAWHGHLYDAHEINRTWIWLDVDEEPKDGVLERARRIEDDVAFAEADGAAILEVLAGMDRIPIDVDGPEDYEQALESFRLLVRASRGERWAARTLARVYPDVLLRAMKRADDDRRRAAGQLRGPLLLYVGHDLAAHPRIEAADLVPEDLVPLLECNDPEVRETAFRRLGDVRATPVRVAGIR